VENLASTGIRSPDSPARSSVAIPTELPGPHKYTYRLIIYMCMYIYRSFATTVTQLKISDFSVEAFKGFEVL
jgi:hypothetical protein